MRFNIISMGCIGLLVFGFALASFAGSMTDTDADGVPDQFDNCVTTPNGPDLGVCPNQQDGDLDGYGNPCDGDLDQDGSVLGSDFTALIGVFGGPNVVGDLDCDGNVLGSDFTALIGLFGGVPGPSGAACADPTGATFPCTP